MRRAVLACLCLAAAACPGLLRERGDFTPLIPVNPRPARLLGLVLAQAKPARVHVMKDGEALGGSNAIGRPGDLLLENDEVAFVVDQLGWGAGFAESGGNLVDAADARDRKDELGQVFTYFGTFPRQGVYDALSSGSSVDGSAWIEARGRELFEPKLVVTTRYTLRPPDRALLVETVLENTGETPIDLPSIGDAIQWGGAEKVAPGKVPGFRGDSSGPYLGGVGRFVSYAITSTEGTIDGTSGGSWTDTVQRRALRLGARAKTSYARVFVVGERPDTSSLIGELAMVAGQPVGVLEVRAGDPTSLPTGTRVTLFADASHEALTLAPPFVGRLPPGRYWAAPLGARTGEVARLGPVDVAAGAMAHLDIPVVAPASLDVRCRAVDGEPIPCKVTIEGIDSTPNPEFGLGHAAGPARNQATTGDGTVQVTLSPGHYRLTASRGPEYSLAVLELALAPGERRSEALSLARVVDTRGYVACDFHQHTMLGTDAPVATRDRVIANAAEGVEVAVASEHNVVADLQPLVKGLHLERVLVEIAGDELTSDASRQPWGHANVFPLRMDTARERGGAPRIRDRTARDVFDSVRAGATDDLVVQVNHPRSGATGYFDRLGFNESTGVGDAPGYAAGFDALEVWNGRNVDARAQVLADWRALLRAGHPVTPTADTDTHGIVGQEAGYPRTYVRVDDDGHFDSWDIARTADLVTGIKVRRDVVLTNGPMLRVSANGAPIGGIVRGRTVLLNVHVECAPWIDVDSLRVARVGVGPRGAIDFPRDEARPLKLAALGTGTRSGARGADVAINLRVENDDALFVVVTGSKPLSPVLGGDERGILPWAMTGAIWVDADGDGTALGR